MEEPSQESSGVIGVQCASRKRQVQECFIQKGCSRNNGKRGVSKDLKNAEGHLVGIEQGGVASQDAHSERIKPDVSDA